MPKFCLVHYYCIACDSLKAQWNLKECKKFVVMKNSPLELCYCGMLSPVCLGDLSPPHDQ